MIKDENELELGIEFLILETFWNSELAQHQVIYQVIFIFRALVNVYDRTVS